VVGGLLVSQLLTLYITPVFYLYMEAFQKKMGGWFGRKTATLTADERR
jgi:HAE1 family hydrophobic/amphiphilic exporter-1